MDVEVVAQLYTQMTFNMSQMKKKCSLSYSVCKSSLHSTSCYLICVFRWKKQVNFNELKLCLWN